MALTQIPYALASVDKVNQALGVTTGADAVRDQRIADMIAAVTDYIEGYCGGRRFLSTAYTEVQDTRRSSYIFLEHRPVTAITSVKYRTGLPATPTWVDYYGNGYLPYLGSGMIRFFSKFVPFPQAFQVVYTAGYLIDWTNFNDPTKHTLPHDLTQVCIELVCGKENKRLSQGVYQESTEGQSVTYESDRYELNDDHKQILNKYKINRVSIAV